MGSLICSAGSLLHVSAPVHLCKTNNLLTVPLALASPVSHVLRKMSSTFCLLARPRLLASGPNGISSTMLRGTAKSIAPTLTTLFNCSLSQGVVPEDWKISNIVLLFQNLGIHLWPPTIDLSPCSPWCPKFSNVSYTRSY